LDILIFVTLGTNDKSFTRLLDCIDKQISLGNIKDKVIVQSGYTKYESKNMEIIDLMPMEEFKKNIETCDILITHGGVGTILDGLKKGKKIIAFPRLSKYGEHVNDHQVEIIDEFYNSGFILTGEVEDVSSLIKECSSFNPKSYKSNNYKFNKLISDTIDSF
jgi:UDP-N-acetylglucosamine transferase subunit ALG13